MRFLLAANVLLTSVVVMASPLHPSPRLTEVERSHLHGKLEDVWSEVDLTIRNHGVDRHDLQRQEKEMEAMGVYAKIPLNGCPATLRQSVQASATKFGIFVSRLTTRRQSGKAPPLPRQLFVDHNRFQFVQDQLVQTYSIRLRVKALESSLKDWSQAWTGMPGHEGQIDAPLLEPAEEGSPWHRLPGKSVIPEWQVSLQGYCFRNVSYPHLALRDPVALLPAWARHRPELFASQEPTLWRLVEKTRTLIPQARPYYQVRERFLLNDARLNFFTRRMSRSAPPRQAG